MHRASLPTHGAQHIPAMMPPPLLFTIFPPFLPSTQQPRHTSSKSAGTWGTAYPSTSCRRRTDGKRRSGCRAQRCATCDSPCTHSTLPPPPTCDCEALPGRAAFNLNLPPVLPFRVTPAPASHQAQTIAVSSSRRRRSSSCCSSNALHEDK